MLFNIVKRIFFKIYQINDQQKTIKKSLPENVSKNLDQIIFRQFGCYFIRKRIELQPRNRRQITALSRNTFLHISLLIAFLQGLINLFVKT